jgi:hypothetical protein
MSAQTSFEVLFQGLDPNNVNFQPVLSMATEFLVSHVSKPTQSLLDV